MSKSLIEEYIYQIIKRSKVKNHHAIIVSASSRIAQEKTIDLLKTEIIGQQDYNNHTYDEKIIDRGDSNSIKIDQVKGIYSWLSLKKTAQVKKQLVIIYEGQYLSVQAQNVLLKVLEEPPSDCAFIISVNSPDSLLTTILSRCQQLSLPSLSKSKFIDILSKTATDLKTEEINQLYYLFRGDIFNAISNIDDGLDGPINDFKDAKHIISTKLGDCFIDIARYQKDRQTAVKLIDSLINISYGAMTSSKEKNSQYVWAKRLDLTLRYRQLISKNVNVKLILDKLLLDFRI